MSPDADLLSAAYRTGGSELEWLAALARQAVPSLNAAAGVYAYTYRIEPGGVIMLGGVAARDAAESYWSALSAWGTANMVSIARIYRTQVTTLGGALRRARSLGVPMSDPTRSFRAHGVQDILVVMGQDGTGSGVILAAPSRSLVELSASRDECLARVAAELAVAHRARILRERSKAKLSHREADVAFWLRRGMTDKEIAHVLGLSLSSVAQYAVRLRQKMGCQRGEELLAMEEESGGGIGSRWDWSERLTRAEHAVACSFVAGRSHVDIARERGSSPRTVASQLASAFRKAGVSGRRELVARWFGRGAR